jgi:hypothetical protein
MARGACCILLAVAIFAPLSRKIYKWNAVSDVQIAAAKKDVVDPGSVLPEPGERTSYVLGCLLACPLLLGLTYGLRNWKHAPEKTSSRLRITATTGAITAVWIYSHSALRGIEYLSVDAMFACAIACLLYLGNCLPGNDARAMPVAAQIVALSACLGLLIWTLCSNDICPLALNVIYRHPLGALPLLLLAWPLMRWLDRDSRAARWSGWLAIGLALVILLLAGLMGEHNAYATRGFHFAAAFDPVAQVQLGKNLLVDYDSQYGLYPDLLAPLFAGIGLNAAKFTLLFGLLSASSFALLSWVLDRVVSRRSVAVVGILAMIFNCWLTFQYNGGSVAPKFLDPYFQYTPLRFVFPACSVALIWAYHRRPSATCYRFANLWLAVGLLWNLDGGVVALAAWTGSLIFDDLYEGTPTRAILRIGQHLLDLTLSITGVVACYAAIKHARYGVWPQFEHLFDYQRLFYMTGFNMLPMHLRGTWLLIVLVYLVGIAQSAAALLARQRSPRQTLVFALSVLGLGLFSYYQGRSHAQCLLICSWPALLLLSIYWDQLVQFRRHATESRIFITGLAAAIGLFLVSSAVSFVGEFPGLCRTAGEHLVETLEPGSLFADDTRILRKYVDRDQALILSPSAPLLHLESGISNVAPGALGQMLWVAQFDSLIKTLDDRDRTWIYIDRHFETQLFIGPKDNEGCKKLMAAIRPHLSKIAETEHGCLYEYRKVRVAIAESAGDQNRD